ncbi:MAG: Zn-ribbon domain-containing OB-fold protein [Methylobacteriaceae bacterium]|nr:Zn-ribbon domain-containing OB-fold protein [Rhodoblastus sp.]MCC0006152.1 Zn-ribbon domain-containing OB-fold protein [Methylobacteriaceae bacterium]
MATKRNILAPVANVETQAYWDAADAGRLLVKKCLACGEPHFYPRALCPFCFGETEWQETNGEGEIYSFSVMRRAEAPYAIAFVKLDAGPTMMSNIVDCDFDRIAIGQRVKVVFQPSNNGHKVPMFTPV